MTKQLAIEIADKLTQKLTDKIKELNTHVEKIIKDDYAATIPDEVKKMFKKHRKYFNQRSMSILLGNGNRWYYKEYKDIPMLGEGRYQVSDKVSDEVFKVECEIKDLKEKREKLQMDIEQTLFRLVTFNRIKEHFPEAAEYLPADSTVPSINMDKLRNDINNI